MEIWADLAKENLALAKAELCALHIPGLAPLRERERPARDVLKTEIRRVRINCRRIDGTPYVFRQMAKRHHVPASRRGDGCGFHDLHLLVAGEAELHEPLTV